MYVYAYIYMHTYMCINAAKAWRKFLDPDGLGRFVKTFYTTNSCPLVTDAILADEAACEKFVVLHLDAQIVHDLDHH
jgi:hypothetical protein